MQGAKEDTDIETYDIYLLPPNEDPETCASWLRMRNRDGRYQLMFEEWVVEGPFIITPRISFEVACLPAPSSAGSVTCSCYARDQYSKEADCHNCATCSLLQCGVSCLHTGGTQGQPMQKQCHCTA